MYCYCIQKSDIQKKGTLIKMAPTLNIFGVVSRFLYSGGWQVCMYMKYTRLRKLYSVDYIAVNT